MKQALSIALKFVSELQKNGVRVQGAYLFGSYAKGNPKPYSDIDVCVVSPDFGKDFVDEMVKMMQVSRNVDDRIEPIPFDMDRLQDPYDPLAAEIRRFGTQINVLY